MAADHKVQIQKFYLQYLDMFMDAVVDPVSVKLVQYRNIIKKVFSK